MNYAAVRHICKLLFSLKWQSYVSKMVAVILDLVKQFFEILPFIWFAR